MGFEHYLFQQLQKHPAMQPQDVVKLCYQASFGPEHMLKDIGKAMDWLDSEMAGLTGSAEPLFEMISDDFIRINLRPWKQKKLSSRWLLNMFAASAAVRPDGKALMEEYMAVVSASLESLPFSAADWQKHLQEYRAAGMPAVHHSEIYRHNESPAYRLVSSRFLRLLPILEKAAEHNGIVRPCVIAIDGRAASGKSTMAQLLSTVLECDVVHMDDFFLPKELRVPERLASPGGNVHYERFIEQVLPCLAKNNEFEYDIFSCHSMDYAGKRTVRCRKFIIVEGSYSCHPKFGDYADIKVFSDVDSSEQIMRILKRNGQQMAKMFAEKWIPMEESYFSTFSMKESCHIQI